MQLTLTIQADSLDEIAHIFAAKAAAYEPNFGQRPETVPATAKEVEPEAPAPKSRRGQKPNTAKQDTPEASTATTEGAPAGPGPSAPGTISTPAEPSTDEKVTLDDLRAAAEPLMAAGKGREIQEMLVSKFNVRAFGPLPEESYPSALAELQNLAA